MSQGSAGDGFGFNDVKGLQRAHEKKEKRKLHHANVTGGHVLVCKGVSFFFVPAGASQLR